jgi:hypothetical protein
LFWQNREDEMNLAALIVAYSRPDGVAKILQVLVSNKISDIYISIDGPKNDLDKDNQKKIVDEASKYIDSETRIHVVKRIQNLGAAGGVLAAVDWFFAEEEMGIIIEDDLRFDVDFCEFALNALDQYRNDPKVWMISGTQLFPNYFVNGQVTWSNYPMIWGWAGWADKWKIMREAIVADKKIEISKLLDRRYLFWLIGAKRALVGKVDAWDTPLAFEFQKRKKLCVLPPINLVTNIGDDNVATNTSNKEKSLHLKIEKLPSNIDLSNEPNSKELQQYNLLLEKNVFRIKYRHVLIPYYSLLLDFIRFPKRNRKRPLSQRITL